MLLSPQICHMWSEGVNKAAYQNICQTAYIFKITRVSVVPDRLLMVQWWRADSDMPIGSKGNFKVQLLGHWESQEGRTRFLLSCPQGPGTQETLSESWWINELLQRWQLWWREDFNVRLGAGGGTCTEPTVWMKQEREDRGMSSDPSPSSPRDDGNPSGACP